MSGMGDRIRSCFGTLQRAVANNKNKPIKPTASNYIFLIRSSTILNIKFTCFMAHFNLRSNMALRKRWRNICLSK